MKSCSNIIAFLLVIVFLVAAPLSILLLNVDNYLLTPGPYLQALSDEEFATRLPGIVAEQLQYSMTYNPCLENPQDCEDNGRSPTEGDVEEGGPPAYLRNLSVEQWQTILAVLLEPSWLEGQSEEVLTTLFPP